MIKLIFEKSAPPVNKIIKQFHYCYCSNLLVAPPVLLEEGEAGVWVVQSLEDGVEASGLDGLRVHAGRVHSSEVLHGLGLPLTGLSLNNFLIQVQLNILE